MKNTVKSPLALVIGATLASGAFITTAQAENPFSSNELSSGYMQLADASKAGEGKCGEGKCGGEKTEKSEEGKCGEGKCGMKHVDADKDGKVSKEEFMKAHEAMFAKMDKDSNGVLEGDELKMHKEGKCGEGKCGGEKAGEGKCGGDKK
ncbi:MAG TPA: hypothetical protein ENK78_06545 [Thiothrix sp.]|nr:hypothetical protein [Thiothrix sp.]